MGKNLFEAAQPTPSPMAKQEHSSSTAGVHGKKNVNDVPLKRAREAHERAAKRHQGTREYIVLDDPDDDDCCDNGIETTDDKYGSSIKYEASDALGSGPRIVGLEGDEDGKSSGDGHPARSSGSGPTSEVDSQVGV